MTTDPRKIIKKARGIPLKPLEIEDPIDILLAEAYENISKEDEHEKQLKIKRDRNFAKAQAARERSLEAKAREEERQREIEKKRLKNLKKARRKLARMRNG